jgi:hypothetical protein
MTYEIVNVGLEIGGKSGVGPAEGGVLYYLLEYFRTCTSFLMIEKT